MNEDREYTEAVEGLRTQLSRPSVRKLYGDVDSYEDAAKYVKSFPLTDEDRAVLKQDRRQGDRNTLSKAERCSQRGFHKMKVEAPVVNGPGRDSSEDGDIYCRECGYSVRWGYTGP